MGSLLVVFDHPPVDGLSDIIQGGEQVLVEQLIAEGPVEAFDVSVLIRLARLDILDGHAVVLGPAGEGLTEELRAVVGSQHLGQATCPLQPIEDADQSLGRDRGVDLDVHRLTIEVIDHVECPEPTAAQQGVGHEVRGPDGVRQSRHVERHPQPLRQSLLGRAPQMQVHGLVHPIDPLVVPGLALAPEQLPALPEAPTRTTFDQGRQRADHLGVPDGPVLWHPVEGRPRQSHAAA